mmetsp:Transcript_44941/g.128741  ORF Transcript_44941/g.128741 Transcript_44941/m.128741 type:complete len:381 (+) Transcript_44941:283-1425(+)
MSRVRSSRSSVLTATSLACGSPIMSFSATLARWTASCAAGTYLSIPLISFILSVWLNSTAHRRSSTCRLADIRAGVSSSTNIPSCACWMASSSCSMSPDSMAVVSDPVTSSSSRNLSSFWVASSRKLAGTPPISASLIASCRNSSLLALMACLRFCRHALTCFTRQLLRVSFACSSRSALTPRCATSAMVLASVGPAVWSDSWKPRRQRRSAFTSFTSALREEWFFSHSFSNPSALSTSSWSFGRPQPVRASRTRLCSEVPAGGTSLRPSAAWRSCVAANRLSWHSSWRLRTTASAMPRRTTASRPGSTPTFSASTTAASRADGCSLGSAAATSILLWAMHRSFAAFSLARDSTASMYSNRNSLLYCSARSTAAWRPLMS